MRQNNKNNRSIKYILSICLLLLSKSSFAVVQKSPGDHRDYLSFTLGNQMKVLVISDPATDKAAASMDVNVGSGANPVDRPGLAHFLEHMLFLGTEKYPEAGSYQAFISQNGGGHNAYTAYSNTNYFFDIQADKLEPALDRFSHFFIDPLFTEKYVDRERHAVNSEYQSKLRDDRNRAYSASKRAMNPEHSMSRFSVGSLKTLSNKDGDLREALIDFYNQYYSANMMSLVVLGKQPVTDLKQLVEQHFGVVKNRNAKPFIDPAPLYTDLPKTVQIRSLKDLKQLSLTFPIPSMHSHFREKPAYYIASMLGYEGKGSLLSALKAAGLANGLSAHTGSDLNNQSTFQLSITLTDAGLKARDQVVEMSFSAIRKLQSEGINESLFEEEARFSALSFKFRENAQPIHEVSHLSRNLQRYGAEYAISADYVMEKFRADLIDQILSAMTPDNMVMTIQARELQADQQDPWFKAEYSISSVTEQQLKDWRLPRQYAALQIRELNPFVANSTELKPVSSPSAHPQLILKQDGYALWHKQDEQFQQPKNDFFVSVISPEANITPKHAVLTALYTRLIKDGLNESLYDAALAGLNTRLYPHMRGFSLKISGYNDKQPQLLRTVVSALKRAEFSDAAFQRIKERYAQELENSRKDKPYNQTIGEVYSLLLQNWNADKKLDALKQLTLKDIQEFVPELLGETEIRMLSHGNMTADEATGMATIVSESLPNQPLTRYRSDIPVVLLDKQHQLTQTLPLEHNDSAISVYYQGQDSSLKTRAEFTLLSEILSAPFYNRLRTEEQLGYVVFGTSLPLRKAPGMAFVVQSPNTDPVGLEQHIMAFVEQMDQQLDTMSSEQLAQFKSSVISRIMRNETRMSELSNRYWQEIDQDEYNFDSREKMVDAISSLTLDDLKYAFNTLPERRLVVRSFGQEHRQTADAAALKAGCESQIARLKMLGQFVPGEV